MRVLLTAGLSLLASCGQPATTNDTTNTLINSAALGPYEIWNYGVEEDKMRDTATYWAELKSSNQPDLAPPYEGGSPLVLRLTKARGDANVDNFAPQLVLSNGQYDCHDDGPSCSVSMKIDDQPVEDLYAVSGDCGQERCLTLHHDFDGPKAEQSLIVDLRSAKRLTLEVPLYRYGNFQYTFDVKGLKWSRETNRQ